MQNRYLVIRLLAVIFALLALVGCASSGSAQAADSNAGISVISSSSLAGSTNTSGDSSDNPSAPEISYSASNVSSIPASGSQTWHIYPVLVDGQGATRYYHWDFKLQENENTGETEYLSVDFSLPEPWELLGRFFNREDIPMSLHLYCEMIPEDETFEDYLDWIGAMSVNTILNQGSFSIDGKEGNFYDNYYRLDGGVHEYIYRIQIEEKSALLTVRFTAVEYMPEIYRPVFEEVIASIAW